MSEQTDFLLARIAQDEQEALPRTVVFSGGRPAPEVLNCIGVNHSGGDGWAVDVSGLGQDERDRLAREHNLTHLAEVPQRPLRECEAKRLMISKALVWVDDPPDGTYSMLMALTIWDEVLNVMCLPYAEHPSFQEKWKP